ncbi:hypothetical protein J2T13_001904 [Paenibacillus sp. DS2015]|uniref:hypothetical protein n=1 Tax=Paenibacillus sp. DS2015 TaxID=3373917 RepID=UPI003D24443C
MDKEQFSVEFPDERTISIEISEIIAKGLPPQVSFLSYVTTMYKQLGFKYLFRDLTEIVFIICLVISILAMMAMGLQSSFEFDHDSIYPFIFMISPILYLVIAYFFFANDKLKDTFEIEMTCKYNVYQLASLRMLIFSAVCMVVNVLFIYFLGLQYEELNLWYAHLISLASLALFSTAFLFIMVRVQVRFTKTIFVACWLGINLLLHMYSRPFYYHLLNSVPIYVYLGFIFICFAIYIKHLKQLIVHKGVGGAI